MTGNKFNFLVSYAKYKRYKLKTYKNFMKGFI